MVHFADGSKVTVKLPSTATASDLLENVKDKLTSSAAQLWLVDVNGDGESCHHSPRAQNGVLP